ncbi:MAG: TIGR00730 family Rossman fold protein [Myxococcales bacterium]
MQVIARVCVYCGSNPGTSPAYCRAAEQVGALLASRGIGIVYGGGRLGLMGALADAALAHGGKVIGVIPRFLKEVEVQHQSLSELHVVETMHERKATMASLSDAFIALPGGIGTLEETFEVWTWTQLGSQRKPVGLLDVDGFYRPLITFLDHLVTEGFLRSTHRSILQIATDPTEMLDLLNRWRPVLDTKWMTDREI